MGIRLCLSVAAQAHQGMEYKEIARDSTKAIRICIFDNNDGIIKT